MVGLFTIPTHLNTRKRISAMGVFRIDTMMLLKGETFVQETRYNRQHQI